ncbi:MAG TPA: IgGFc-binding protein [Polyangiaceae bacterium]|nr:IgGFc-binding protein [Polyangiaceae bacterium]
MRRLAWVVGVLGVGIASVVSCGGGNSGFNLDGGSDATNGDDGSNGPDTNFGFGDTGPNSDGSACARGCSSDLHDVIDCNNNVLTQCTGTDGCDVATTQCINACQAAVDNKNSIGCEYYATEMDQEGGSSYCFVAFVANTWDTDAHISVDFNGASLPVANFTRIPSGKGQNITYAPYNGALPAGQVAIVFLGGGSGGAPQCPIASAENTAAIMTGTGIGHSFHITTDVPVVAYEMNPYGGGSVAVTGASLLLPTSAWDTNYIASTASPDTAGSPGITIIAAQDNTQVSFLPKVALSGGGGIPAGAANTTVKFNLNKGQQAQIEQTTDLVGSVISSNNPVGVMAGNPCMNAPQGTSYCDHGEQMLPPVRALGNEYVGVQYRPRHTEPAIWRVLGAVDGTALTFTPAIGASSGLPAAPASLNQGQMAEFATGTPFVVKSQDDKHPFLMFEYMAGSEWAPIGSTGFCTASTWSGFGDPDFSVQVPPQQYLSHYVIMTDPSYPETDLVLIRRPDANNNFQDVSIDCLGTPIGGWQTIGGYQWTRVDLQTGNFQDVNGCSNGRHELKSLAPFGLNVWGWGTPNTTSFTCNVSYSYPGGMNVQPINSVVVPPTPH